MIRNLLRFAGLRHARRKPLRVALTILGIALGVALFVAISAINDSTLAFFRENVGSMTGKATFTVLGSEAGFGEEAVETVKNVDGVASAVPMIESRARTLDGQTLVVFGIDLLQESAVRDYRGDQADTDVIEDPLEFLNQGDSLIVTKRFAAARGLQVDSTIDLLTALGTKRFTVRGLLEPSGPAKAYGGGVAIMDIDGAREMFGKDGKVDRIDIVPAAGVDEVALAARIQAALDAPTAGRTGGSGLRVERREDQSEALAKMVAGYQGILAFCSLLALLIGMFLVANTIAVAVADRRREIAVLRAVGASRKGVLAMFVIDAAWMGVLGGAIGALLGRELAGLLVERVSASMSRQYVTPIDVADLQFSSAQAIMGVIAGLVAAVLASIWPAWQATRISGSEAFGSGPAGAPAVAKTRRAKLLRAIGIGLLAAFGALSATGISNPALDAIKPLFGVVGAVLAAPLLVALGLRGLAWLVDARGPLGRFAVLRLAAQNLLRDPARTGGNVLSLVIGLMLVITMAVIQSSFTTSIGDWNDRVLRSDLWVSSVGRVLALDVQPLDESLGAEIDRIPGVDIADGKGARGFRIVHHRHQGRQIVIKAMEPQHPRVGNAWFDVIDRPVDEAVGALFAKDAVGALISQNFGAHFGVATGDTLTLQTPSGPQPFAVLGTVVDYGSPEGTLYLSRAVYKRLWRDPLVTAFAVEVAPGSSVDDVRTALEATLGKRGLIATKNSELRGQFDEMMEESFGYTRAIEIAALGIGLLALLSTLLVSLLARTRELGMLRAIGMSRGQLARMIVGEAVLLGAFGGIAAALLGVYLARLWVVSTLAASLGWYVHVHVPLASVATTVGSGLAVGAIVGLLCAQRVAALEIRAALEQS
ncbi:MAG: ABC transporter permease [Deltaproteobacteria bacterium]|nr:ABC transporter permease [Deltaproteobacteria bacterium]